MSDLKTFLRDTSIYLSGEAPEPEVLDAVIAEITKTIEDIGGEILDLGQGPVIELSVEPEEVHLTLGQLGKYLFPHTLDTLSQVHARLVSISKSPRFIKAIQGLWPA